MVKKINKKLSSTILLIGFHSILTRLRSDPSSIHKIFVAENRKDKRSKTLILKAKQIGLSVELVSNDKLKILCGEIKNQGVAAFVEKRLLSESLLELLQNFNVIREDFYPTLIFLDGVTDSRNLGAILRTAESVGAGGVIAPMNHSAPLNNLAISTSCGASETVPYVKVPNIARSIEMVQDFGYKVIGMEAEASLNLFSLDLTTSIAFVFGDEGTGLKKRTSEFCDHLVGLPMRGDVESLNISVACAVSMFEDCRQKFHTN